MMLIVTSKEDVASMNIRERLLSLARWEETSSMEGKLVYAFGDMRMALIDELHLFEDNLDQRFEKATGSKLSLVVFASKHRSESGKATLTVHPIGNYGSADFGGKPGTLVPSAPREMSQAIRLLKNHGAGLPYEISFETTHHGPSLSTPTFFFEIGSDESRWPDKAAAEAIAKSILELAGHEAGQLRGQSTAPLVVGVGGGHYAPRHTDVAISGVADFGHMVPNYALEQEPEKHIQMALEATPGAKAVYLHRKSMKKPLVRQLEEWCASNGVTVFRSGDK